MSSRVIKKTFMKYYRSETKDCCLKVTDQQRRRRIRQKDVEEALQAAKEMFLTNDKYLLQVEANERSLTHKFAEYLQKVIDKRWTGKWKVDCEYNRYGLDIKTVPNEVQEAVGTKTRTNDTEARTVYPDIIIHKRGKKEKNLVVIEAKKMKNNRDNSSLGADRKKLRVIQNKFRYKYAILLEFNISKKDIKWNFLENKKNQSSAISLQ